MRSHSAVWTPAAGRQALSCGGIAPRVVVQEIAALGWMMGSYVLGIVSRHTNSPVLRLFVLRELQVGDAH